MNRILYSVVIFIATCSASTVFGQGMPDNIKMHFDKMIVGDWKCSQKYDGDTSTLYVSWRWSSSGTTAVGNWTESGISFTQIASWDEDAEAVVFTGVSSRGDSWTHRYNQLTEEKWSGDGKGVWDGKKFGSPVSIKWIDDKGSFVYNDITDGKPFVLEGKRVNTTGPAEALQSFGTFMVGRWTRTDDGFEREHRYSWGLKKKFIRSNGRKDPNPWDGFIGIDRRVNKLGWWGFFANENAGVIHLVEVSDDMWIFEGIDHGLDGPFNRKVTVKRLSSNKLHARVEDTQEGKILEPLVDEVWEKSKSK